MASRENQTFQITIILLAMLSIVLAVSTYMLYRKSTDATAAALAANDASSAAGVRERDAQTESNLAKVMMGYPETEGMETIQQAYDTTKLAFADSAEQQDLGYHGWVGLLMSEMDTLNRTLAEEIANSERLQIEWSDKIAAHDLARQNAKDAEDEAVKKAKADHKSLMADVRATNGRNLALVEELNGFKKVREDAVKKLETEMADLNSRNDDLKKQREILMKRVDDFEVVATAASHGKVTWVSNSVGSVYINLGEADGLKAHTTLSVFDQSIGDVGAAKPKGSIEVVAILGPHAAEARITDDSITDPILSGDQVFSSVWRPGQQTHFALAGFMDLDGDGVSDREFVREVIKLQGGVIDAELHDDGTLTGKLSVNTDHFVVGDTEKLAQSADPDLKKRIAANYKILRNDADDKGVDLISTTRLLDLLGWKGKPRTILVPEKAGDERFRTRKPPQAAAGGSTL